MRPTVIVVGGDSQPLAHAVEARLHGCGIRVLLVTPGTLGRLRVTLSGGTFRVEDCPVAGIFSLSFPDERFSDDFAESDQSFCNAEIGATWLAASHLESVLAINRYDAAAWFDKLTWPLWLRRLSEAGIPTSPFSFGDRLVEEGSQRWYPYASGLEQQAPEQCVCRVLGSALTKSRQAKVTLVVCGDVLEGDAAPHVIRAAEILAASGVRIAAITTDGNGDVLSVNPRPVILADNLLHAVSDRVEKEYIAHLRTW